MRRGEWEAWMVEGAFRIKDGFYYLSTTLEELVPVDVLFANKGEVRDGQTDQSRGVEGHH